MKYFIYSGLLWKSSFTRADGPFCNNCKFELVIQEGKKQVCVDCGKEFNYSSQDITVLAYYAQKKYEANKRSEEPVISLDLPPTKVGMEAEDKNYFVNVRMGQKDGKKTAVIYLGEKLKNQTAKDKVQLFVDLDDEQVRFDKTNKHPMALLSKLEVVFPSHSVEYRKSKKRLSNM